MNQIQKEVSPQELKRAQEYAYGRGFTARPSKPLKDRNENRMAHEKVFGRHFAEGVDVGPTLRRFGFGAAPTGPGTQGLAACDENTALARALKAVTSYGFMAQPVIEYVRTTYSMPQSDGAISEAWGSTVDTFNPAQPAGSVQSSSFLGKNGTLQVDMFAAGMGLHFYAAPVSFAIPGNAVLTTVTTPIWSPDVWTQNDLLNGLLAPELEAGSVVPATLDWGGCVHEMLWYMSQAYRVRLYMNQKFIVLDEPLSDFAYFTSYGSAEMQGTSERAIAPYIAQVNANYRALGSNYIFEPVNGRRIGSITAAGPLNEGVFHPTNDYKFADVTYGGMAFEQGYCCKPYHQFASPILFDRGITIALLLEMSDTYNYDQMVRLMSISQGVGGTNALVHIDENVNGFTGNNGVAGQELTLDQGANAFASQSVNTDTQVFEGGSFETFAGIKGREFWGNWKDELKKAANMGMIQAPTITGQWHGTAIAA